MVFISCSVDYREGPVWFSEEANTADFIFSSILFLWFLESYLYHKGLILGLYTRFQNFFKDTSPPTLIQHEALCVLAELTLVSCQMLTVLSVIPMLSWLQPFLRPPHPISWGILFEDFHPMHVYVYLGWLCLAASSASVSVQEIKIQLWLPSVEKKKSGLPFHSQVVLFPLWIQNNVGKKTEQKSSK